MAGTALSPGEAASVRVHDVTLPDGEFGAVLVRAGEGREVPVSADLVGVLRRWIDRADLKTDDLLFPGERGGLSSSEYRRVWRQPRQAVLSLDEVQAGLGEQVSCLRDSCLDRWLKTGLPSSSVKAAERVPPHIRRLLRVDLYEVTDENHVRRLPPS
jgi:integrase